MENNPRLSLLAWLKGRWVAVCVTVTAVALVAAAVLFYAGQEEAAPSFPRQQTDFMSGPALENALSANSRALELDPEDEKAMLERGVLLYQQGPTAYLDAIKALEAARDLGALDVRLFYYLGVMYQYEGLYEYAAKEYQRFLNNVPQDMETRLLLGKLYFQAAEYDRALGQFDAVLAAAPDDEIALENAALALIKLGKSDRFRAVESRLRGLGSQASARAAYVAGVKAYGEGSYAEALERITEAEKDLAGAVLPEIGDGEFVRIKARALFALEKYEESAEAWKDLLAKLPGDEEAKKELARAVRSARPSRHSK